LIAVSSKKSEKTYHSAKGTFTNDNDKDTQDKLYSEKLNDRLKRFGIEPECDLECLYNDGIE
jgi:hypothetical protein